MEMDGTLCLAYSAAAGVLWRQGATRHCGGVPCCPSGSRPVPRRLVRSGANADTAFHDMPYTYAAEQAVAKFFQGLLDKEVDKHAVTHIDGGCNAP